MQTLPPTFSSWSCNCRAALWALTLALPLQAQAFFGDDEARKAILDLRARVEANRLAAEQANEKLTRELTDKFSREGADQLSRDIRSQLESELLKSRSGLLELVNQLEVLRKELAELRGQNEQLARALSDTQRQQLNVLASVDERLRSVEPVQVKVDGQTFAARPEETAAFDAAMAALRASDFERAARLYGQFVAQFPASGYVPVALYWQGNAHYASRNYKPAIESYQRLLVVAPSHPRAPEAMLAIANCHLELKDARAAKTALQDLLKAHPDTEAGATAKDRLSRMR